MPEPQATTSTVLYVEDEESDALLMRMAFERAGLGPALRVVENGRAAMEYLSGVGAYAERDRHPVPKVVLLDLNLPVVPGFEVLRWMRSQADYRTTPVVIFSSSPHEQDKVVAQALGADHYVEKPRSVGQFGTVVQDIRDRWLRTDGAK